MGLLPGLGLWLGWRVRVRIAAATSLPLVPPLVASSSVPIVSTASPAFASNCSGSPVSKPLMSSLTDSRVTGGTLGGGVLGGGMGGGGGGEGWMVVRSISASRYWIELRLMYVVEVSEKLAKIVRARVGGGGRVRVRV